VATDVLRTDGIRRPDLDHAGDGATVEWPERRQRLLELRCGVTEISMSPKSASSARRPTFAWSSCTACRCSRSGSRQRSSIRCEPSEPLKYAFVSTPDPFRPHEVGELLEDRLDLHRVLGRFFGSISAVPWLWSENCSCRAARTDRAARSRAACGGEASL